MDLARYPKTLDDSPQHQDYIDQAVPLINAGLVELNVKHSVPTPWIARPVHIYRKGHRKCLYYLLDDGLHPGKQLRRFWAEQYLAVALKIITSGD